MSTNEPPPPPPNVPPPSGYGETPPPTPPPAPPGGTGGYSVGNAFSYGWSKFTQNVGQILLAVVVLVAVLIVIELVGFVISNAVACDPSVNLDTGEVKSCNGGIFTAQTIVSWLFSLVSWIVSMIIGAGIVRAALDITEGRQLQPSTLLKPNKLGDVIVASLVIGVLTFVGFVLCVIPGFLVMFFTSYTLYFLMDRPELGAMDAIRASFEFTKNNAGNVILWFLVSIVAWLVGAVLCGIGLIVAVPVVLIGTAYTYKTLNNEPVAA
jgi:uncharacterized membrane protein